MYGSNVINLGASPQHIDVYCASKYEMIQKQNIYPGQYAAVRYSKMWDKNIIPDYKEGISTDTKYCVETTEDGFQILYRTSNIDGERYQPFMQPFETFEEVNRYFDWFEEKENNFGEMPEEYLGYNNTMWLKTIQDLNNNNNDDDFIQVSLTMTVGDLEEVMKTLFSSKKIIFNCGDAKAQ